MFSGVFHLFALRKRLDIGDSPYAVIPTQFQVVAARLSCEQWYLFLYSSVFYTNNHLDIYRYVLRYLFISLLCTHFIAKHMVFTGSENKFWIFETQHYLCIFLTFSDKKINVFPLLSSRRIGVFVPLSNSFPWQLTLRKLLFSWC